MSPDVKEFFSKYDEEIRFLSPAQQKEHMALLLAPIAAIYTCLPTL
jgi:hypothetical protein